MEQIFEPEHFPRTRKEFDAFLAAGQLTQFFWQAPFQPVGKADWGRLIYKLQLALDPAKPTKPFWMLDITERTGLGKDKQILHYWLPIPMAETLARAWWQRMTQRGWRAERQEHSGLFRV